MTRSWRDSVRSSPPCPRRTDGAYRLGGDEFCLIATVGEGEAEPLIDRACEALTERGEGFEIESSFGAIMLPDEATDASHALQIADERLYAQKYSRRGESDRTMAALLEALSVREPELQEQLADVGSLAVDVGRMLGLRRDELEELERAAQLHDLGKLAVPDEILHKAWPARRARVGVRPAAHHRRRADPPRVACAPQRRDHRALVARELGRKRLSGRARRRGHPARLADHPRVQRLRRDDVGSRRTATRSPSTTR